MKTIDTRTFKEKAHERFLRARLKMYSTAEWVKEHPVETVQILGKIATISALAVNAGSRIYAANEERKQRTSVYCNDIQSTMRLKHQLTYSEARELRNRMNCGETKFEALDEMGLLKA